MIMKKLSFLMILSCALMFVVAGCNKDEENPIGLYQEYEVFIDGPSKSAFANFRLGDERGTRVKLGSGSTILCNTQTMYYNMEDAFFNYFVALEPNHKKAIFQLRDPNGKTYRNEADFSDLPNITFTSGSTAAEDGTVTLDLDGANPLYVKVRATPAKVTGTIDSSLANYPELTVNSKGEFNIANLPNDEYRFMVDYTRVVATQQNDRDAKGSITIIKRVSRIVKKASAADDSEN